MWFPIIVLLAQLGSAPAPVQKAYQKLTAAEIDAKKVTTADKPPKDARKIDVSAKIRSASFGHKTWLLIAPSGKEFWVEYGRSTNKAGGTYGPFAVEGAAPEEKTEKTEKSEKSPPQATTPPPAATPPATKN